MPQTKKPWKARFLIALEKQGSISGACRVVKVNRSTVYREARIDMQFRQQWEDVAEAAADALEVEARKRAFNGSDTLLIFLLKGAKPGIYREGPITQAHLLEVLGKIIDILHQELGPDDARRIMRIFQKEVLGIDHDKDEPAPLGLDTHPEPE